MTSRLRTITRSLVSLSLAALFLFLAFRGTNFTDLWKSLQEVNYLWIALVVPIGLLSHIVRAWRWKYLLNHVKPDLSVRNLFSAVMIGYMVNNVLPRIGELVRPYVIGKLEGVSKSTALGTVVVERIIDMMSFLFLLFFVLFFFPQSLTAVVGDVDSVRPLFLIGSAVSFVVFVLLFLKSESVFRFLKHLTVIVPNRFAYRMDSILESFLSGFRVSSMGEKFVPVGLLSLSMWGLYTLALYVPFQAFDPIAEAGLGLSAAVILLTLSTVAFILPVPGAFGTYHSFLKFALVTMYGIDEITALSFSIVTHELGYIMVMGVGIGYFLKDHIKVSDVPLGTSEGRTAST